MLPSPFKCVLESENEFGYKSIGITISSTHPIEIVFPRGFNLSKDTKLQKKDILLLIKVFNKYIQRKKQKAFEFNLKNFNSGYGNYVAIDSLIWLINDYLSHGLFTQSLSSYIENHTGNINWPRTFKKITPIIPKNNYIYPSFITKKNFNDDSNIILITQKYVLEFCFNTIGWLFPNFKFDTGNTLPYSRQLCINKLKKLLISENVDRTKHLISHLIKVLSSAGSEKSSTKHKEFKTNYFFNIWEDMLRVVLGNQTESNYYSNGEWLLEGEKPIPTSHLKPDIILKYDKNIYVIDAKYYKFGITKDPLDLPQSSDIAKQLLYSEYISEQSKLNTFDCFILPYETTNKDSLKFIGSASISSIFENKKIIAILADTKTIMKEYIYDTQRSNLKSELIKIILKQNEKV